MFYGSQIMPDTVSTLTADATKAVAALPLVTSALSQFQSDLTTSQHASVVSATADALNLAVQSAQALNEAGLIGHQDATTIGKGVALTSDGCGLFTELQSFAAKLKALVADIV